MKIVVISDTHIPNRAEWLPKQIDEYITQGNFDMLICLGDLTNEEIFNYLKKIANEAYFVRGNMDYLNLPRQQIIEVEGIRIGAIHGDGIYPRGNRKQLANIARKLDVNVLLSGHTHVPDIHFVKDKNILLANPGSATGAWGGGGGTMKPSFITLDVEAKSINLRLYELEEKLKCVFEEKYNY